jgi:hypothetical protein
MPSAYGLYLELFDVLRINPELRHVAAAIFGHIPRLGNLPSVRFVEHRIEDRLLGKSRWERAKVSKRDELQFLGPDRSIENFHSIGVSSVSQFTIGSMQSSGGCGDSLHVSG